MNNYEYFMGVDPGLSGGYAIIDAIGTVIEVVKTPETPKDYMEKLKNYSDKKIFCVIEQVHSMPQNGSKANFTFGWVVGVLESVLTFTQIPFEQSSPQKWMKYMGMKKDKSEEKTQYKNRLKEKAQQLFPKEKVTLWNADALLIAEYCRRNYSKNFVS